MALDPITGGEDLAGVVTKTIGGVLDRILPDKEAAAAATAELAEKTLAAISAADVGQLEVNKVEAGSSNLFVSGWRPAIGWVCCLAFAWVYFFQPIVVCVAAACGKVLTLPTLDVSQMMPVLLGMLGLGTMRTYEKATGVEPPTNAVVTSKTTSRPRVLRALPVQ
jgi:hypothetical protein